MTSRNRHIVVDGSNIATEGRSLPSLVQLDEAVRAYIAENPDQQVTVVVDATFAHRIDKSESKMFEAAVDAGEIIVPPAGAVGRGDAFILQVAEKADALVLSNDSFQEFHGEHPWLFEEGRLIGVKPVEGVGWIFVERTPVRGPASRRASREAKQQPSRRRSSKKAAKKSAEKKSTAKKSPERRTSAKDKATEKRSASAKQSSEPERPTKPASSKRSGQGDSSKDVEELNTPQDFVRFVSKNSIGDEIEGVVDSYSSHGCYLRSDSALCYLPCKAMGDPTPNRARDVVSLGQRVIARIDSLDSDRRGVNVSLIKVIDDDRPPVDSGRRSKRSQSSKETSSEADGSARDSKSTRSRTTVASQSQNKPAAKKSAKKAPAKKATKKATKKAPAKKTPAKKSAKKTPAKKSAKKAPAKATTSSRATKAAARKASAKKATKKAPAKKTTKKSAKKAPAKKTTKKK